MLPNNRQSFKEYVMRSLGWPVIEINVTDEQIEDRVDEALQFYRDYHPDASERVYYKHQITQTDIDNGYIELPENIFGAVRVFNLNSRMTSVNNLFGIQYQLALNELYTFSSYSMVPYYMGMMHLELIDQILVGEKPIRYTRHRNRLWIDTDWNLLGENKFLLVEAWEVIDPEIYTDIWSDRWLYRYCEQLIKKNWGNNLKKFGNMQLPSGIVFNGQQIFDEANAEIAKLEDEMYNTHSLPAQSIFIG